jgi:ATP-dependent helicase/DNAse subunit B
MSKLHAVTATDPRRLLEAAAEAFLEVRTERPADPFPTPPYLLALRQGGLRDDLIALAQQRGVPGWFDPPLCIFAELPEWLGATARQPLDAVERQVLLSHLLRASSGAILGRLRHPEQFVDSLDRWFGELAAEGVSPDSYERAAHRPRGDAFAQGRDSELTALYGAYVTALGHTRRDGRDTLVDIAGALRSREGGLPDRMSGRREIRLFGLHDLRGGWRVLLRELVASPAIDRVVLYTTRLPPDGLAGMDCTVDSLPEPATLATRLFTDGIRAAGTVEVIEAPDPERELEEVARRARLLHEDGVPLHEIALVVRRARPHGDLAVEALRRFGLPATARQRRRIVEVPVVRALLALFQAADEGWSRHAIVELADQPCFASGLDTTVLNFAGFRARIAGLADWEKALEELAADARQREDDMAGGRLDEDGRGTLPAASRCEATLAAFRAFATEAARLEAPRPLADWVRLLHEILAPDPWRLEAQARRVPGSRYDLVRADQLGWNEVQALTTEWLKALDAWGDGRAPLGAGEFLARLKVALNGDVILRPHTAYGVQVLEGLAAAYRSFRHLFLAGLEAGQFPVRPPGSPLLDESDREALRAAGLPLDLRADWDQRERELFRVLVAGGREGLVLSSSRTDAIGGETIPSAFLEAVGDAAIKQPTPIPSSRVLTPGARLAQDDAALQRAAHTADIERIRESGDPSAWSGRITAPDLLEHLASTFGAERIWSPTQLESYAKCPWAYFSSRLLRLEKREEPDDALEPAVRGILLHDVLRRLYDGLGAAPGNPVLLLKADRDRALAVLPAALDAALAEASTRHWLGHPSFRNAQRAELMRLLTAYLDFEISENEKYANARTARAKQVCTGVTRHEERFDDAVLERDGIRLRYRGFIDRVEEGLDDPRYLAAVDYKTSKYSIPGTKGNKEDGWSDGVVLQVPLYLHALRTLHPGRIPTRVEYRAIKQGEAVHLLSLHQRSTGTGEVREDPDSMARMDRALDQAVEHVRRLCTGAFPPAPPASCKCPPFCHAWAICRVPGGPDSGRAP